MYKLSLSAVSLAALTIGASSVLAAPIEYEGTATIFDGAVNNVDGKFGLFFSETPMTGDQISFRATFDPDTIQLVDPSLDGFPETAQYVGGLTDIEFTIGSTTLSAEADPPVFSQSGLFVTTADPDPMDPSMGQVGIQFFNDGFSLTIGSPLGQPRWSANLFFFDALSDLPNADAPTALPNIDDFMFAGFGLRVFDDTGGANDTNPASLGSLLDELAVFDPPAPPPPPVPPAPPPPTPTPPPPTPTPIPEPSSLALLGLGLAGLGLSRRR